jgi:hypothetical protein
MDLILSAYGAELGESARRCRRAQLGACDEAIAVGPSGLCAALGMALPS